MVSPSVSCFTSPTESRVRTGSTATASRTPLQIGKVAAWPIAAGVVLKQCRSRDGFVVRSHQVFDNLKEGRLSTDPARMGKS